MTLSEQIKSGFEDLKSVFSKAPAALAGFEELQANFDTLKAERDTLAGKLTQAETDAATSKAAIDALTTEKETLSKDLKAANDKLANPGEQIKQAASAQAAAITAGIGVPPVNVAPEASPNQPTGPDIKGLTGLAKVIAIEKAEAAARKSK